MLANAMAQSVLLCLFSVTASSYLLLAAEQGTLQSRGPILTVDSARPVAKAMVILEDRYQQPITYEEGPYVFPGDLDDLTATSAKRRIVTLKTWRLESDIELPETVTKTELLTLITRVLRADAVSRGLSTGTFRVRESRYGLHVVPTHVRDREGNETLVTPLLDTRITLVTPRQDLYSVLQAFCDAVSKAGGTNLSLAPVPLDFGKRPAAAAAKNETARDVLIRLLEEQKLVRSWHVLFSPTNNNFILGIGRPGRLMPVK